ncbi:ATP-binding protein [Fulvivirgaceae bacterium BMA12]|uniref:ATP-binding protein n=1 Tax=Agaribacillus aureus TaxID=3051825 RepID=A0ABT8LK56_9BACT|nr:ATP-binding protein [Fulvivirgaceae bacterium BMA12]
MLATNSFKADINNLAVLIDWIDQFEIENLPISKVKLKLLLNEAFVNACENVNDAATEVRVIIKRLSRRHGLSIIVTDQGRGFNIDGLRGGFKPAMIGKSYLVSPHPNLDLYAIPENVNKISFSSTVTNTHRASLPDRSRGILSMVNVADKVEYFYDPDSFNYLKISLFNPK